MKEEWHTTRLVVDFFTHSYRISGSVNIRRRQLADQLEDRTTAFLQLEDAYVSNIEHPADIVASHASLTLRKDRIIIAVITRQENGLPRKHTYGSYLGTYLSKVFLIAPSFEIAGYLRLSSKLDLRTVLTTGADNFVSILDGQMRSSTRPDISFTGGVILVNKSHVEAFWVEEEEDGETYGQDSGN